MLANRLTYTTSPTRSSMCRPVGQYLIPDSLFYLIEKPSFCRVAWRYFPEVVYLRASSPATSNSIKRFYHLVGIYRSIPYFKYAECPLQIFWCPAPILQMFRAVGASLPIGNKRPPIWVLLISRVLVCILFEASPTYEPISNRFAVSDLLANPVENWIISKA